MRPFFWASVKGRIAVLNLIATHSPRLAAMANNKPYGEDIVRNPALLHRMALSQMKRESTITAQSKAAAESLRERTA